MTRLLAAAAATAILTPVALAAAVRQPKAAGYPTARAAAATAPRCFSKATLVVSVERRPLPPLPLPRHLERRPELTRLYLVTYRLLRRDAVDRLGRRQLFAYVARPNTHALWHVAVCGTGP